MNNLTPGELLRSYRDKKDWSQDDLSQRTGISQPRLSVLENGIRQPTQKEWALLVLHLEMHNHRHLPVKQKLPYPDRSWKVSPPDPCSYGDVTLSSRLRSACQSFGSVAERLLRMVKQREDASLCFKFLNEARLDSGVEGASWLHGFGAGGRPCWYAPIKAGFRKHRIVDHTKKRTISDVRLPCLEVVREKYALLLFPQVRLDVRCAVYRLDALVCVMRQKQRCWVNVEFDGGGHDSQFDHRREFHLGLPTVRFTKKDLERDDFFLLLETRLLEAMDRWEQAS